MLEHLNKNQPFYGDVTNIADYKTSLEKVLEAETLFNAMSADVREKFKNDPQEMITFLEDPNNIDEAVELGMVTKKVVPEPHNPGTQPKPEENEPATPK